MERMDIMIKWIINLFRKNAHEDCECEDCSCDDEYSFDFAVGLSAEDDTYYLPTVASLTSNVSKTIHHGGKHYPDTITLKCLDLEDVNTIDAMLNKHKQVHVSIDLYETNVAPVTFKLGYVFGPMHYTIELDYNNMSPMYIVTLKLNATYGMSMAVKEE